MNSNNNISANVSITTNIARKSTQSCTVLIELISSDGRRLKKTVTQSAVNRGLESQDILENILSYLAPQEIETLTIITGRKFSQLVVHVIQRREFALSNSLISFLCENLDPIWYSPQIAKLQAISKVVFIDELEGSSAAASAAPTTRRGLATIKPKLLEAAAAIKPIFSQIPLSEVVNLKRLSNRLPIQLRDFFKKHCLLNFNKSLAFSKELVAAQDFKSLEEISSLVPNTYIVKFIEQLLSFDADTKMKIIDIMTNVIRGYSDDIIKMRLYSLLPALLLISIGENGRAEISPVMVAKVRTMIEFAIQASIALPDNLLQTRCDLLKITHPLGEQKLTVTKIFDIISVDSILKYSRVPPDFLLINYLAPLAAKTMNRNPKATLLALKKGLAMSKLGRHESGIINEIIKIGVTPQVINDIGQQIVMIYPERPLESEECLTLLEEIANLMPNEPGKRVVLSVIEMSRRLFPEMLERYAAGVIND